MNPETIIAAVTGIVMATVPEPYAGQLMTKLRDYFAALVEQSAEEAKTSAARENAAAAVAQVLPTIVDSPLPSTPTPLLTPAVSDLPEVSRDAQRSEPPSSIQQPAMPVPEPISEPAPDPTPVPPPEPPKKNNGRNQAPVF